MKSPVTFVGLVCVAVSGVFGAQENVMRPLPAKGVAAFVQADRLDFLAILPAPPAADSVAAQADLEAVLQVQAWRTPEQVEWAKLVEKDHVFNNASVLGEWFEAERLPATAGFFKSVGDDLKAIDAASKKPFLRVRPSAMDPRVQPCVTLPASSSYPSGSAMQEFVWAELLAEMVPEKRDALLARAHRAAWGRVIGGVHFPSDVVAGRRLAAAYLTECRASAAFRAAQEASRREIRVAGGR